MYFINYTFYNEKTIFFKPSGKKKFRKKFEQFLFRDVIRNSFVFLSIAFLLFFYVIRHLL